jgi:hypothetical protein
MEQLENKVYRTSVKKIKMILALNDQDTKWINVGINWHFSKCGILVIRDFWGPCDQFEKIQYDLQRYGFTLKLEFT